MATFSDIKGFERCSGCGLKIVMVGRSHNCPGRWLAPEAREELNGVLGGSVGAPLSGSQDAPAEEKAAPRALRGQTRQAGILDEQPSSRQNVAHEDVEEARDTAVEGAAHSPKSYYGRDPDKHREYMRDYMKRYRARKKQK